MIWTEEEDSIRQINNLLDRKGKSCKNCNWSGYSPNDDIITCGHHIQNFSADSFCAYWTDRDDKKLQEHYDKIKAKLEAKKTKQKETTAPCPQCQGGGCPYCCGYGTISK